MGTGKLTDMRGIFENKGHGPNYHDPLYRRSRFAGEEIV